MLPVENSNTKLALLPFHESIVLFLKRCSDPTGPKTVCLLELIAETKVPENHDAIIDAINGLLCFPGVPVSKIKLAAESVERQKSCS